MREMRVDAAIAAESHDVQTMRAPVAHGIKQHGMLEEFARRNHLIDSRDVHVDHASRADIQMPDFTVAHLPLGQSHKRSRGVDQCVRKIAQQRIVGGLARGRDGVALGSGRKSPTIQNGQEQGFLFALHYWWKAFRPANFAASPSSSSMRKSWLYFAMRSVRLAEPVLICPARVATARSAMKASSVSPDRCDTTFV